MDELIKNEAKIQLASKKSKLSSLMPQQRPPINTMNHMSYGILLGNINGASNGSSASKSHFECVVFADVAFGNQYGCWVCEGCKEFSKEKTGKNTEVYGIFRHGNCNFFRDWLFFWKNFYFLYFKCQNFNKIKNSLNVAS